MSEFMEWMKEKRSRPPVDKVMDLKEAVSKYVQSGCCLGLGLNFHPTAATYEMCSQGVTDLTLVWDSHVWLASVLIGLGRVKKAEFAYNWGGIEGQDNVWRRAVEKGIPRPIEIEEYSNYSMGQRWFAGSIGLPFMPTKSMLGSDMITYNPRIKVMQDPYGGEPVALVPASNPDVALIHVQKADSMGNCQMMGIYGNTDVLARASRRVIVTCEEIVPTGEIRRSPNLTVIPYMYVDAVVEVPYGGHYRECSYYYLHDLPFGLWTYEQWATHEGFLKWCDEYVLGPKNWKEYCDKIGWDRLTTLTRIERKFQQYGEVRW